jgi:uncharacterized membrane protein YraQ (UPF0718 family)
MSDVSVASQVITPKLRQARAGGLLLLVTVLSALFYYKWGASLRAYGGLQATGKLAVNPDLLLRGGPWTATLVYFGKIWPALVYGLVIGAIVRAAIPPTWIGRALGAPGLKGSLAGGLTGAPLMLCSCCVTPIFTGLYERGARLSSSLAVMLAAPGFNVAALILTFALLPARIAVARAMCAIVIVLALPLLLSRLEATMETRASCALEPTEATEPRDFFVRFFRSLGYLVVVTVPLIVVGVVLGGFALHYVTRLAAVSALVAVPLVALVSTVVALPTFFEIPIALVMTQLGAPPGVALAVLVAGPIVNLPSLLVLGRETSPRLAGLLAAGVWGIASLGGIVLSL